MRFSENPAKAWLILDTKGSLTPGHCDYMAGNSEVCSHVAAIAFILQLYSEQKSKANSEDLACTDKLSEWTAPSLSKKIMPKQMKDVDSGKTIKIKAFNGEFLLNFFNIVSRKNYFLTDAEGVQVLK